MKYLYRFLNCVVLFTFFCIHGVSFLYAQDIVPQGISSMIVVGHKQQLDYSERIVRYPVAANVEYECVSGCRLAHPESLL